MSFGLRRLLHRDQSGHLTGFAGQVLDQLIEEVTTIVERLHAEAFIQAMNAAQVRVDKHDAEAIAGDARSIGDFPLVAIE